MTVNSLQQPVDASMHFLQRSSKYDTEKPYSLRFPAPEGLAHSNVLSEEHQIQVESMRDRDDLTLETSSFELMPFKSPLSYEDFESKEKIEQGLLPALCQRLKSHLNAEHVIALDHSVRRRHKSFPISTGKDYDYDQPTAMAHVDFTVEESEKMLRIMYPEFAEDIIKGGYKIINAWRPLRGPLNDWPLAICDARTVDNEADLMPGDIVYPDWATENLQVHHNPNHKWYYLPDQTADEVLIFKSADSSPQKSQAVPHGSFNNPRVGKDEPLRESIDMRFFVFFAPLNEYPSNPGNIFSRRPH
ncbi:hypothetical protein QBC45DRAFT_421917 [Copromyces sp. CBS 386.78]|nr:hypothetical protein QBC45DRAFT_421917 [Copromyces sp. CBS 386.78]